MRKLEDMKIALLTPFINVYGGAEYQLEVVANEVVPNADILTFSYSNSMLERLGIDKSRVFPLLGKGIFSKLYKQMTPLYPAIIDSTDLSDYDLVLSFSYAYVHGVITDESTPHIAHIETPMRLLWEGEFQHYIYDKVPFVRGIYRTILAYQRKWDRQAATRADFMLSNSKEIKNRISRVWNRDAEVIYPPVNVNFYNPNGPVEKGDYFITHSRLVRYKRIDLLIDSMRRLGKKLVIIGDGPELANLKKISRNSSWITFTGHASEEEKRDLLQKAKGFLYASYEDFGIAPIEAMAAGLPIYAYGRGGAAETVTSSAGVFFEQQNTESIISGFKRFERFAEEFDYRKSVRRAEKFSKENFIGLYHDKIAEYMRSFHSNWPPILD